MQFGRDDVLMMTSLAEASPQLFRKSIVSVDLMSDSEEQMLSVISSCFASTGGGRTFASTRCSHEKAVTTPPELWSITMGRPCWMCARSRLYVRVSPCAYT